MFCPKCGTSLEDNAVFCSECGARIRETGATVPGNAAAAGSNGKSPSVKKKFPVKTAAILSGLLVLIIAVTVIIGSAVSSARPENIAADYLKNYYNGEIKKADKDCIVTMRDQWELSIEKYHNGNKKAYFMFLTSSYESNVTSFSSAYKALDKMTHKRFSDYYGESYTVEVKKRKARSERQRRRYRTEPTVRVRLYLRHDRRIGAFGQCGKIPRDRFHRRQRGGQNDLKRHNPCRV